MLTAITISHVWVFDQDVALDQENCIGRSLKQQAESPVRQLWSPRVRPIGAGSLLLLIFASHLASILRAQKRIPASIRMFGSQGV